MTNRDINGSNDDLAPRREPGLKVRRRARQLLHAGGLGDLLAPGALVDDEDSRTIPPPGTSFEPENDPERLCGRRVDRYTISELLGEGGFGVVYLARQTQPVNRSVALKIIKSGMDSREINRRFETERRVLARMNHPNIATVLDAGITGDGRQYFVMELVKGVPMHRYCENRQLDLHARLQLFLEVCAAIQHAHQNRVIHRDIKPSNILVSEAHGRPVVKVIDFGIAKALDLRSDEQTVYTSVGQFIGTPQYMSPEQAAGPGREVDQRSDIFALGAVLFELLTGSTPITREQVREAGFQNLHQAICDATCTRASTRVSPPETTRGRSRKGHKLRTELRGDLDWILMKSLAREPERRYESAAALAADVRRYLRHEPVQATPPSTLYTMRKLVRRNRLASLAFLLLAISLVAGITTSSLLYLKLRQSERALQQREIAQLHHPSSSLNHPHQ